MPHDRTGESLVAMTVTSWKLSTTSRSTTSLGVRSPANLAKGTAYGSCSGGSAAPEFSRPSSSCWWNAARRHTWSSYSTAQQHALTSRPRERQGAAPPSIWPLARQFLDQNPSQDRSRRQPSRLHLTGGEASDLTQFETSLDIGPDIRPRIAMTDKILCRRSGST